MPKTFFIAAAIATLLPACSGAPGELSGTAGSAIGAQTLSAVQACVSQAQTCAQGASSIAAASSCQQQLSACLAALCEDAGPPSGGSFDAGAFLPPSGFDAGSPGVLDDASFVSLPDASFSPVAFGDAGFPAPLAEDGGFSLSVPDASAIVTSVSACLQTLASCLSGGTDPAACATQVSTCLENAI